MNKYDLDYQRISDEADAELKRIDEKILQRSRQIERLKKKRDKVYYSFSWIDNVVKPLMHDLEKATGLTGEIYGPFGLRAETSIYLRKDMSKSITETETLSIELEHMSDGTYYATGEETNNYQPMSIGWLNGFHHVMAPLPDTLEEIIALLHKS